MSRPVEDPPEWGTAESNDTEPGSGQKASGWTVGQVAVSSYQNWWQRVAYEWLTYLKNVVTGVDGDWQLSNSRTDASQTPIVIGQGPEAHAAGNAWKKLFRANAGGSRNFRILSGKIGQSQGVVMTLNADWNPATQQWSLEDSSANAIAIALDWGTSGLIVWRKSALSAAWGPTDWNKGPVDIGDLEIAGDLGVGDDLSVAGDGSFGGNVLMAGDLDITDDLTVGSQITVNGLAEFTQTVSLSGSADLELASDVTLAGEIFYNAPKTRFRSFSANAFHSSDPATRDMNQGTITGNAGGATNHVLHLDAPAQTTLWAVEIHYDASGGSQVIANVERINVATGAVANLRSSGGLNSSGTGSNQAMTLTCDQNNILTPSSNAYQVRITLAANTGAVLRGVTVEYRMDRPKVY